MTDVSVKVPDEALQAAMHKAILDSLGAIGQEKIIKEVISYLTTEGDSYYGNRKPSPLKGIMYECATTIARATIREQMLNDANFLARVKELYQQVVEKFLSIETREKLVTKLADAFESALSKA